MREWIEKFKSHGLLKVIDEPVDIDQEMGYIAYVEVKKADSKALLFTHPIDKSGRHFAPVLMNTFGSSAACELIFGQDPEKIAAEIAALLKPEKPANFKEKIDFLRYLVSLRKVFTKRLNKKGICQEVAKFGDEIDLFSLPALKTWEFDGGQFITMGQVYTRSLDGKCQNLGMYRLQLHDKNHLGMHWQIHKDGANFFNEYKNAGQKMPVSVVIGGDPLYIWCGQAPLPKGIFELLLYGFIRKSPARLVKSLTNDIWIPHDGDFVIEGFVDTDKMALEGPFGDHTGFYTPIEPFPVMEVSAITHKSSPIFHATIVGKPPIEDKFMGKATERIFLPLFKTTAPDLIDYNMPENGCFHNLILAKFECKFPAHAKQLMHAFWGVGQMSFVKHAIFADENAPNLNEYAKFSEYVLNRISPKSLLISSGLTDQLDHASPNSCFGGKLGIDASSDFSEDAPQVIKDDELLELFKSADSSVLNLKQYFTNTKNPIVVMNYDKKTSVKPAFEKLLKFRENFKILIFVNPEISVQNAYMLIWWITNSIDAERDIFIDGEQICIDATQKFEWEGYQREWPRAVSCNAEVIKSLIERGLIEKDDELFLKYEI